MANSGERNNYFIIIEYDGSGYHGWQRQKGVLTIQEVIESRLAIMTGENVTVWASGRTDAGVHALGQAAHFLSRTKIPHDALWKGLNSLLPEDIVIRELKQVHRKFHARFHAKSKVYEYRILNRPLRSALLRNYVWHVPHELDISSIESALDILKGEHDFKAFQASGSKVKNTVRKLFRAEVAKKPNDMLVFTFEANGFLRYMVRNLVGTLIDLGKGKFTVEQINEILESRDRQKAGMTAPARGLYLVEVKYE